MNKAKILTLDIETSPLQSFHWGLFDQNISLDMIKIDWTILSFSAKWFGQKKVQFFCTGGRGVDKVRDDKELVKKLWQLLDEADIVVTQNGVAFDIKKINTRMLVHGLPPYSPVKMVDTLLIAKARFGFTSNKLAFLSKVLNKTKKSSHKKFPGFELWEQCLADNPAAWNEMRKYNSIDVIATEELYMKLRPWYDRHPHMGLFSEGSKPVCPKCGSDDLVKDGTRAIMAGVQQRYRCRDCHGILYNKPVPHSKTKKERMMRNP